MVSYTQQHQDINKTHYQDPVVEQEEREEKKLEKEKVKVKEKMMEMEKYRLQKGYTERTICGYTEIEDCPCMCAIS